MTKSKRLSKKMSSIYKDAYQIPSEITINNADNNLLNNITSFSDLVDESRLYQKSNIRYSNSQPGFDTNWEVRHQPKPIPIGGSTNFDSSSVGKTIGDTISSDDMYELARQSNIRKQSRPVSPGRSVVLRSFSDDDMRRLANESNLRKEARKRASQTVEQTASQTTKNASSGLLSSGALKGDVIQSTSDNISKSAGRAFSDDDLYKFAQETNARKASRLASQGSESMALISMNKPSVPAAIKTAKSAGKEAAEGVAEGAAKKVGKSLLDKAVDMKIPQIALGVGVTAWLVNKLSDSRGQQSNAQLYGQQGY